MNWSNVRLIFLREVRDQLRDRRTLFMIAVLPLMLYPLLGMSFFQITQFMREHPVRVLVVGAPDSDALPRLLEGDRFDEKLFTDAKTRGLLQVTAEPAGSPPTATKPEPRDAARHAMSEGNFDVAVYFAPDFTEQFSRFRRGLVERGDERTVEGKIAGIDVFENLAKDASKAAHRRVVDVLERWRDEIGRRNLAESKVSAAAARPFDITTLDVAKEGQQTAAVWSKILPFVLLIWALTGAFYPAIDLCAGEKERGTLETLLSSPAERIEIVWGKLLTIMLFSIATSMLNVTSLALTGSLILSRLPNLGPPPGAAIAWLLVALLPVSALFGALCLALAAFARSTKEGQYYLMPLVLVTMPLTILSLAPGVELNLGNSLIPVTGVVLLLRVVLEGEYWQALPYVPLVAAVTLCCCWLAIRWATNQFNTESVLFRESERWDLGTWVKHLRRDRQPTPSFAEAMCCGVLILMIQFFFNFALAGKGYGDNLIALACMTQLVVVLTPALLMTVMLTASPAQTLLLRRPPLLAPVAAVALAITLNPAINLLRSIIMRVYPLTDELNDALTRLESGLTGNMGLAFLAIAVLPAVCEELAFRGFILSGFRRLGHKWTAIGLTSILFGATHAIFQQSLVACIVGVVIGFIAIQTGSLLPGILFHLVNNALALVIKMASPALADERHWLHWLVRAEAEDGQLYHWPVILLGLAISGLLLYWFHRLPYSRTPEESLQEAIERQQAQWLPG